MKNRWSRLSDETEIKNILMGVKRVEMSNIVEVGAYERWWRWRALSEVDLMIVWFYGKFYKRDT